MLDSKIKEQIYDLYINKQLSQKEIVTFLNIDADILKSYIANNKLRIKLFKFCENCNKKFETYRHSSRFCSKKCRLDFAQKNFKYYKRGKPGKRICLNCNREFYYDGITLSHYKDKDSKCGVDASKFCSYECGKNIHVLKVKQTNLEKYGTECSLHNENIHQKTLTTWLKNYGTDNPLKSTEIKLKSIKKQQENGNDRQSKMETIWLDTLNITERQKAITINDKYVYFVDGFDEKTNTVYEFLGDFWHGNPNPNTNKGRIFTEKSKNFLKTKQRFFMLKAAGYTIKYIWEYDFKNNLFLKGRLFIDKLEY